MHKKYTEFSDCSAGMESNGDLCDFRIMFVFDFPVSRVTKTELRLSYHNLTLERILVS